jgi:hypothetical protein
VLGEALIDAVEARVVLGEALIDAVEARVVLGEALVNAVEARVVLGEALVNAFSEPVDAPVEPVEARKEFRDVASERPDIVLQVIDLSLGYDHGVSVASGTDSCREWWEAVDTKSERRPGRYWLAIRCFSSTRVR